MTTAITSPPTKARRLVTSAACNSPDWTSSTNATAIADGGRMISGFQPGARNSHTSRTTAMDPRRTVQSVIFGVKARRRGADAACPCASRMLLISRGRPVQDEARAPVPELHESRVRDDRRHGPRPLDVHCDDLADTCGPRRK